MKYDAAYRRRHERVRSARGKASWHACVGSCGGQAKEWAQIHGKDGESPDDYQPMCWKCHQKYDNRWNAEERAKVSASMKLVWANSPERKEAMRLKPHRLRGGGNKP